MVLRKEPTFVVRRDFCTIPVTRHYVVVQHRNRVRKMNRTVIWHGGVWFATDSIYTRSQVVDATPCEILSNPQSFDGKIVRVKGVACGRL